LEFLRGGRFLQSISRIVVAAHGSDDDGVPEPGRAASPVRDGFAMTRNKRVKEEG
jgi:hypothetical protein